MIKKFKIFEKFEDIDPYGEEDWEDDNYIPIDWNTEIEIGDKIYFFNNKIIGEVLKIIKPSSDFKQEQEEYILDTHRRVWKSMLIGMDARIIKRKLNENKLNESGLNSNKLSDFEVGDRIVYTYNGKNSSTSEGLNKELCGMLGEVIITNHNKAFLGIEFDEKNDRFHNCNGLGKEKRCYYVIPSAVKLYDPIKIEKRKRKKEELRLKHLDIDPYGEEDWEVNESVENPELFGKSIVLKNKKNALHRKTINGWNIENTLQNIGWWFKIKRIIMGINNYTLVNDGGHNDIFYNLDNFDFKPEPKRIFSKEDPYGEEDWTIESINHSDIDPYGEEEWDDDNMDTLQFMKNIQRGTKVICIKDTDLVSHYYSKPIKKGEIKIIFGIGTQVFFEDTPGGWGAYDKKHFKLL